MPKIPRSIVVIYILMIIVLLGLCAGVFIVLFSNVTDDSQKSSSTSYPLIESSRSVSSSVSSSTSSSITESSSSTDVVFTSTESTESSTQSSSESSSSTTFVPGDTPSEHFDLSFFADDLFIGDSIFTGFYLYPGYLEMSQVAAAVGLTPYKAYTSVLDDKGFSNARFVRNLFERTYGKATMRTRLEGGSVPTLTKEDFRLAGSDREFAGMMAKKPNKMGFTL